MTQKDEKHNMKHKPQKDDISPSTRAESDMTQKDEKRMKYTREDLLKIIEKSFVPENEWSDRDSAEAQKQLGWCYAWLKAGCEFSILSKGDLKTDDHTIWVNIKAHGFAKCDWGGDLEDENFYLPTEKRLKETSGKDWY
jgi:hypothetical protein